MFTQTIVMLLGATFLVHRVFLLVVEVRRHVLVVGHQGDDHGLIVLDFFGHADLADDFGDFEFGFDWRQGAARRRGLFRLFLR